MKFSGELKIRVVESSKNVSISFIDKGCGMDKGVEKILGLSSPRRLVEPAWPVPV
jgi:hypothetical protein